MIQITDVTKQFGALKALDNFSLEIPGGTILGLLGPNGAGKTTMMRIMAGYLRPNSGSILIDGIEARGPHRDLNRKIGYLPENNPLYEDMLVEESLSFVTSLRGMDPQSSKKAIKRVIKEAGLADVYYKSVDSLSKGFRQRLGLAQAIIHSPSILILDEPTEGLDPNQRVEIRNLIRKIGETNTVIVSTHVLQEANAICDRVAIINKGKLVTEGTTDSLLAREKGQQQVTVEVGGKDVRRKFAALEGASIQDVEKVGKLYRLTVIGGADGDMRPEIFKLAVDSDLVIYEMFSNELSLEEVFRKMTQDTQDTYEDA